MSLPAKKQAFLDQLRVYALVPQDPVHLNLFLDLLDKYVAGLEEPSGSNEPDPASPQPLPDVPPVVAIPNPTISSEEFKKAQDAQGKPSLLDRVNNLMSKKPEDSDVSK
jgi:hypothetical protein